MTEESTSLTRRSVVKTVSMAAGGAAVGGAGLWYGTRSAAAATVTSSYTSQDITISGDGGEVDRLSIQSNEFLVAWEGFGAFDSADGDVVEVDIRLTAVNDTGGTALTVFDETFTSADVTQARANSSGDTLTPANVDVISGGAGGAVTDQALIDANLDPVNDLNADSDGGQNQTTVLLEATTTVRVDDSSGTGLQSAADTASSTFTLTADNITSTVTSDGSSTTDGSGS